MIILKQIGELILQILNGCSVHCGFSGAITSFFLKYWELAILSQLKLICLVIKSQNRIFLQFMSAEIIRGKIRGPVYRDSEFLYKYVTGWRPESATAPRTQRRPGRRSPFSCGKCRREVRIL